MQNHDQGLYTPGLVTSMSQPASPAYRGYLDGVSRLDLYIQVLLTSRASRFSTVVCTAIMNLSPWLLNMALPRISWSSRSRNENKSYGWGIVGLGLGKRWVKWGWSEMWRRWGGVVLGGGDGVGWYWVMGCGWVGMGWNWVGWNRVGWRRDIRAG